ncbi:folliculin [Colletes latitarsis]|uniref:folliculin n=1 Tax=Colletes latitarsis TaxID=2605962 RepID=UPI004036BA98
MWEDTTDIKMEGPIINDESGKIFVSIILMACEAIIACIRQLNRMGEEFGNGDYGTNFACGAQVIKDNIQENKILGINPYATFMQIGRIIHRTVNGLHGKLYALFLFKIAKVFSEYESNKQITADMWFNALIVACKEMEQIQLPNIADQSMISALVEVQLHLTNVLNENVDPIDAFGVAVRTAEKFAMNTKFKYPYPQAHAIGIWMRAAYEDGQYECEGCQSIGNVKYLSNEHETRTSFLSAQQSLTQDVWCLLKHACFRSLSCEVHPGKEGVCYFGDEYRGHVLSHTFTLKDAQARGFRRWCSFIVFMRDKQFLLNMWPFLVDNLKEVIRELQDFAEKKYNAEEAECPQRIVRLTTANNGSRSYNNLNKQPRTFSDITNEKHVFIRIHMWLVWILSAGARHFIEIFPMSFIDDELSYNLEHQIETEEGFTLVNAKLPVNLNLNSNESEAISEFSEVLEKSTTVILRNLRSILGKDQFRQLLYSSLTGVQILVRGPSIQRLESLYGLSSLIPCACRRVKARATEYMDPNKCNFIGMDTSVAVPLPCASVCRLDIISDEHKVENSQSHIVRWTGSLPLKLPTLLTKIERSLDNEKLGNSTLKAHFAALQEEWANIAKVVHAMRGRGHSGDLSGLMLSLGAGPHDKKLLDAWSMGLPPNPA